MLEHVEAGAGDLAPGKRPGERGFIDDRAARRIDELGRLLHQLQFARADPVARFRRERRVDRYEVGLGQQPLEQLLAESDFVSIHAPLTPETRHRIGARELKLMKKTAYLINTARGPMVDEAALARALARRRIAGAGLDVFEHEPKVERALMKMPNVVLSPHLGSAVTELREEMAHVVVDNIFAILEGRVPPNCINPEVLTS